MASTAGATQPTKLDLYGSCPNCGTSWDGGDIPVNIREHYAPPYKWSRVIGIETPGYDGVSIWQCPDCEYRLYREGCPRD